MQELILNMEESSDATLDLDRFRDLETFTMR
jgi:hypothetical protein